MTCGIDFECLIDDEIKREALEATAISSNSSANYYIGIIKANREEMKKITTRAKEIVDDYKFRTELWRDKQIEILENQNNYILQMLKSYYDANGDGKSKLKFPNGNIGNYAIRESIKYDDEKALVDFIREEKKKSPLGFQNILKLEYKLNKDELKSKITFTEDGKAILEGVELPFVTHTEKSEAFNVR